MNGSEEVSGDAFSYQPDPKKPFFVQPKAEKLIRRGPCEYFIVGRTPDGRRIETRLSSVTFRMEGLS